MVGEGLSTLLDRQTTQVLSSVGGFDQVVKRLLTEIGSAAARHSEASQGIVLLGPHGSGKSHLAEAIVASSGGPRLVVDLVAATVSIEALIALRGALVAASIFANDAPCGAAAIVVLEKADIVSQSSDAVGVDPRSAALELIASAFRVWKTKSLPAVMLMLWSGEAAKIPAGILGSGLFELELTLPVPLSYSSRRGILAVCLKDLPLLEDADALLSDIADMTAGFLPCDLQALCRGAALKAINRQGKACNLDEACLQLDDFRSARCCMVPTPARGGTIRLAGPKAGNEVAAGRHHGLEAVVGQIETIEQLRRFVVEPFRRLIREERLTDTDGADSARGDPPIGIVLEGKPGCGKSFLAAQLAEELRVNAFVAAPAEVLGSRLGESEKRMANLFSQARRSAPSCLILEDLPAIASNRNEGGTEDTHGTSRRVAGVLRAELDVLQMKRLEHWKFRMGHVVRPALASEATMLVVGTASSCLDVDSRLLVPHRISMKFELQDALPSTDVAELLRRALQKHSSEPLALDAEEALSSIAASLSVSCPNGGHGAGVLSLCREAAVKAVRRAVTVGNDGDVRVRGEDLHASYSALCQRWRSQ